MITYLMQSLKQKRVKNLNNFREQKLKQNQVEEEEQADMIVK